MDKEQRDIAEDQLERWAEAEMNKLDRRLMAGRLTQEQHDAQVVALNKRVEIATANIR